ncbi:MAG: tRNA pseudouridine(55) synthase TruB [Candidatus Omnitrophica bacterium]|nr:tRNA pseudouridine(55) synthase TruB [Candidatus Omnitrophota bacterium]MDD5671659.1 tRNA pseudouridine(55) synthase TruB [Candidatus Omnitrophota bacterium]
MVNLSEEFKLDGVLIVDKPPDWTSHDVCAFIRKRFHIKKVGHAGTLDPLATGLLVVLLGKATKHSIELSSCDKEYLGVMELGVETDSHDRQGNVVARAAWEHVTVDVIRNKAREFTGEIIQVPPMVSALKHKGVRLYKLARQGKTVPREGRKVIIHELKIESQDGALVHFFARVSKGTYLRTLINDLGKAMGCLASLFQLRRIRSGNFVLQDSVTVESLRQFSPAELRDKVFPLHSVVSYANSHRPQGL